MTAPATQAPSRAGARLQVADLTVSFAGVRVLDRVRLAVAPGRVHALIGPNGAGKSTLLNVISGIYRARQGSVLIDGTDVCRAKPAAIAGLGVGRAFQNGSMFTSLTVEENLLLGRHRLMRSGALGCAFHLPRARAEERLARQRVAELAGFVGVEHLLGRGAGELAYGEAKRVDLARALCTEPRLLLLDEPAAGLLRADKAALRGTIRRIADELGVTIVLIEHDMPLVMAAADQVTVLSHGTVIADGTPERIRADPRVVEAYLGRGAGGADRSAGQAAVGEPGGGVTG